MNLTEFFNIIKKYGDGSFAFPLLEEFLKTKNKPDLTNFFDNYKNDNKLASSIDSKKYAQVVGTILDDHKSYGGDLNSITASMQQNPDKMTISSYAVRNLALREERTHRFTINVSGILLYDLVEKIYNLSKEMNYNLDMEIPAVKDQKSGLTDTITIYSSNNNLFNTIDFLQAVSKFEKSFGEQCPFYAQISEGIAYDSYNERHSKWNRDLVGESTVEAIDDMLEDYIENHPDLYGNASSVNYKHDRVNMVRNMMRQLREEESNRDVYQIYNEYLEKTFIKNDIDPDNIYVSENVHEKFFGPRVRVEDVVPNNGDLTPEELESLDEVIQETTRSAIENGLNEEQRVAEEESRQETPSEQTFGASHAFVPLIDIVPRVEEDVNVYGESKSLKLTSDNIPLNPLDYMIPTNPSGSLKPLDEFDKVNDSQFSSREGEEKEGEEVFFDESKINFSLNDEPESPKEETSKEALFDESKITLPSEAFLVTEDEESEKKEDEVPADEPYDVNTSFGANMTIPEETSKEDVSAEEYHVEDVIDKIFGTGELGDINLDLENYGEGLDSGVDQKTVGEDNTEVQSIAEGLLPKEEPVIEDNVGSEEQVAKEGISEEPVIPEDTSFSLLKDLMEEPETKEQPREKDTIKALKEFQEKRAQEIKQMEESAKSELDKVTAPKERSTNQGRSDESLQMEQYLQSLLEGQGENQGQPASIITDEERLVRPKISSERNEEEKALDAMLDALNNPVSRSETSEEERHEVAVYEHVESDEERRLAAMERLALEGPVKNKEEDTPEQTTVRKSTPIARGEAEEYLDNVLDEMKKAGKNGEFDGFNEEMVGMETAEPSALNPSDLFGDALSREEKMESNKTEAERLFDERVRANEAMNASKKQELPKEDTSQKVTYEHVDSEEQLRMNKLLEDALNPQVKEEFKGFSEEMFASDNQEMSPSALFGVSEDAQAQYEIEAQERKKREEHLDKMLNGEYHEPPAVVIETPEPTKVPEKKKNEHEEAMDELLRNVDKSVPSVIPKSGEVVHTTHTQVKSPHEEELDKLMEMVLNPPAKKEEDTEFKGFDDTLGDEPAYMEIAESADSLIADAVDDVYSSQMENMSVGDKYLEELLASYSEPKSGTTEERVQKVQSSKSSGETTKSEEELRLEELYRDSLIPKSEVINPAEERKNGHVPSISPEMNAKEREMEEQLRKMEESPVEPEFTGFEGISLIGTAPDMVSGNQSLIGASLEEKIKQVAEMERQKTEGEKHMDSMLDGSYVEEPAVKIETPEMIGAKPLPTSTQEQGMDEQLKEVQEMSPSELFTGISRANRDNFSPEEKADNIPEGELTAGELFQGFDASMLDSVDEEMVTSASDLFGSALPVGVTPIISEAEEKAALEDHLGKMIGLLDETKDKIEEVEMPIEKTASKVESQDNKEEEFTGFDGMDEVFFDDRSEDEKLNEAMEQVSFTPLSSAFLSEEEKAALLDMDKPDKYDFIGLDVQTPIIDESGNEITLRDYLEKNKVLDILKPGVEVMTLEGTMTTEEFIRDRLVPCIIINGNVNFQEFIADNIFSDITDNYKFGM